jgi:hypothetical protein
MYKISGAPCNDCRGDFLEVTSTGNALPLLVGLQQLIIFVGCWFPMFQFHDQPSVCEARKSLSL